MSSLLPENLNYYLEKVKNLEPDLKEGLVCFIIGVFGLIFLDFFSHFINVFWVYAIIFDFMAFAFILVGKFNYKFNSYFSIGLGSIFTGNSLILRLIRICFYGLLVQIIFFQRLISFFNIMMFLFIVLFSIYFYFNKTIEIGKDNSILLEKKYSKYESVLKILLVVSCLAILGIMMKLYNIYSIGGWDEGWYADITTRMFQTQNWFMPLYLDDTSGRLLLFDKPPLMFILGSIGIALFGYTSLAIKWTMGVFSGLMGVAGYLIYSHQKRINESKYIPELERNVKNKNSDFDKDEALEKTSDGKVVGIIFGLSMSVTWFLSFYGRTAYLDPAIVAISAFTALFAVKAIDHWFYGNTRRAYVYIVLTAIINMLDLFAKAWQGLLVGPSIAIYFFVRYYEYFVPRQHLLDFFHNVKETIRENSTNAKVLALISSLITVISFQDFIPKTNSTLVCTEDSVQSCITFVPHFSFSLFNITIQYWSVFLAFFVYMAVVSVTELISKSVESDFWPSYLNFKTDNYRAENQQNDIKRYFIPSLLVIESVISGLIGSFVGATAFEFVYDRFYKALTEIFQTYFTYEGSMANRTLYGELIDGSFGVFFAGFIVLLSVWIFYIFISAIIDIVSRLIFKKQIFKYNFGTGIVAEWSLVVPLIFYAVVLGYWIFFLLFKGDIFNRSSSSLMMIGILLSVLAYLVASFYLDFLKYIYKDKLKNDITNTYYQNWIKGINRLLIFVTITCILIILSFYPFLAWIEYMDKYKVCLTTVTPICPAGKYVIRLPGELATSGIRQGTLTYTWLFFTYYVNWRYTGSGSQYSVVSSLGGLIGPLFLACLPFFITGIYALLKKRDYANLSLYLSWFFVVLITFLPATFQLNYYYLAIFFPYFGITSYGMFWTLRRTPSNLNFKNMEEKLLLSIPIFLLLFFSMIFYPFIANFSFLKNTNDFNYFIVSAIFVIVGFAICTIYFVRSIPESFALAFIIFYLYNNLFSVGIGNTDTDFIIISAILIGIAIFTAKDRIPIGSLFFLLLIILSAVSTTAWWANYKAVDDDQYQQMGQFILDHGGNYNYSTWVFPDTGARYAMRYYLHGLRLNFGNNYGGYPFSYNSNSTMNSYIANNPEVKFFVITTQSYGDTGVATTAYTVAFNWLIVHYILVDFLIHKVYWQRVHLYVDKSVLSASELKALNIS